MSKQGVSKLYTEAMRSVREKIINGKEAEITKEELDCLENLARKSENSGYVLINDKIIHLGWNLVNVWMRCSRERFVRLDRVGHFKISTVFSAFLPDDLFFESMVFADDFVDLDCLHARTKEAALVNHKILVEKAKQGLYDNT